jgi:hypothetical protein
MLKPKLQENQIYSFKLLNGDELVAKLITDDMMQYIISKPLTCIFSPQGLGLTQWMITANMDNNFEIPKNVVLSIAKTRKEISDQYTMTTTGIKPAGPGILSQ